MITKILRFAIYPMALMYMAAGIYHFVNPSMYLKMMPPYLPAPELLILLSGVAEFGLGLLLLWPRTRRLAAWGVIALLVAVFPANLYMYQVGAENFPEIPTWALILRLPIQIILIGWAWLYTRKKFI